MSLATWKALYYPEPASAPKTAVAAVEHSLRKWRGLRPNVLEEHGLRKAFRSVSEFGSDVSFLVDVETCALCAMFLPKVGPFDPECGPCPLAQYLGRPCDDSSGSWAPSPYSVFASYGDPEPMVAALEGALAQVLSSGGGEDGE